MQSIPRSLPRVFTRSLSTSSSYTLSAIGTFPSLTPTSPRAPAGHELQITWLASGIDTLDLRGINDDPNTPAFLPPSLPWTPGTDGVGVVKAAGSSTSVAKEGDLVVPVVKGAGTWAEEVTLDEEMVTKIGGDMRMEIAATVTSGVAVGLKALKETGAETGDVVVVTDAGGTVGGWVVQMGKVMGYRMVGITEKVEDVERVKVFGAEVVVAKNGVEWLKEILEEMGGKKYGVHLGGEDVGMWMKQEVGDDNVVVAEGGRGTVGRRVGIGGVHEVKEGVGKVEEWVRNGDVKGWVERVGFEEVAKRVGQDGGQGRGGRKLVAVMKAASGDAV